MSRVCCHSFCDRPATHGFGFFVWSRSGVKQFNGEMPKLWFCSSCAPKVQSDASRQLGVIEAGGYAKTIEEHFEGMSEVVDWSSLKVYLPPIPLAAATPGQRWGRA